MKVLFVQRWGYVIQSFKKYKCEMRSQRTHGTFRGRGGERKINKESVCLV